MSIIMRNPKAQITVRTMKLNEASEVAMLHHQGIPQGFLSKLGKGFMASMYEGITKSENSGVWVAVDETDRVMGFIAGTLHVGRCYKSVLLRRGLVMAYYALPSLFSTNALHQVIETIMYPKRETDTGPLQALEPTAELLSLAVAPEARGTGAATLLCNELEGNLQKWGLNGPYRVVTMADDPRSNSFYRKVGFQFIHEFLHHGITMNLYHKDLLK